MILTLGNNIAHKYTTIIKDRIVKTRIIQSAFELFAQYGIKSISMDAIAHSTGMSKRTIYGYFIDKEELITEGIDFYCSKTKKLCSVLNKSHNSVLNIVLSFYSMAIKNPQYYSKKFSIDLQKYPLAQKKLEDEKKIFSNECLNLFHRGVKEGVFRKDINFGILVLLLKEQIIMQHLSKEFSIYSYKEVYNTILFTFLRGICTAKGLDILENTPAPESDEK